MQNKKCSAALTGCGGGGGGVCACTTAEAFDLLLLFLLRQKQLQHVAVNSIGERENNRHLLRVLCVCKRTAAAAVESR